MLSKLTEDIISVCKVLNKHDVEYLIVGGTAVSLYGFYRMSVSSSGETMDKHDLDFWYNPTYNNYFNLLNALEELGEDVKQFKEEIAPNPRKSFFQLEFQEFSVDFLPEVLGLGRFGISYNERVVSKIDGEEIPLISYEDLIINKKTTGRKKDIDDINNLESSKGS